MNRRRFIARAACCAAGLSLTAPLIRISESAAAGGGAPLVARVTGPDYDLLVRETIELMGGMGRYVKPGQRVVVKPNIGWDRRPAQAANTHPAVVRTLAELALEAGAEDVKIFDHTCNEKRRCYINSGIDEAVSAIGDRRVKLLHIDRRKFVPVRIERGRALTEWEIYKDALAADCYINVPAAKHHGLSRLTLGLKNSMGVIGGRRGSLHHDIGQKLADLATVISPELTVVDATRMLLDNGPQGGSEADVKKQDTLIASTDPVAADALATTLFGLAPEEISSTVAAYRMGLGEMNPANMRIIERTL